MMMGKAMQCAFLGMIFLASGTSALQCHSSTYIWSAVSTGDWGDHSRALDESVTCSKACMEAQLKLRIAESILMVTHRGCADKEDKDEKGKVTTDKINPHFNMQYNERYCSTDLCNDNMTSYYFYNWIPGETTAPEGSGSNHCYAGILTQYFDVNLKGVTCSKGYDQCYSGLAQVSSEFISRVVIIKTCSQPNFPESQNLTFGPIKFNQLGSSCLGSNCNRAKKLV